MCPCAAHAAACALPQVTVDDLKDVEFHRHRRETINVFDMAKEITRLSGLVSGMTLELAKTKSALEAKVAGDIKSMQDDTAKSLADAKAATDKAVGDVKTSLAATTKEINTKVAKDLLKTNDQVAANTKKIQDDLAPVKVQVGKLQTDVKAAAAAAADPVVICATPLVRSRVQHDIDVRACSYPHSHLFLVVLLRTLSSTT